MRDQNQGRDFAAIANRHGLSLDAVRALAEALGRGHGGGAQWNHPDLGGMGQSLGGGMLQIGAMFDTDLKRRVGAALVELADTAGREQSGEPVQAGAGAWWPEGLGSPASSGAQNAMRYACFPDARRLVVDDHGIVTVYDTGSLRLTGVAQAQGGTTQTLRFSGPDGGIDLRDLAPLR